jgi:hypothetical protein
MPADFSGAAILRQDLSRSTKSGQYDRQLLADCVEKVSFPKTLEY